jgi:SAM-dependent methyltransferase
VVWAEHADVFDRSIARYDQPLMVAAGIGAADRVLDIGCGTGHTTRHAARLARAGEAVGVDLSARMLQVARTRAAAAGLDNVRFVQADAQTYPFEPAGFDVAISRTGTMFFGDPAAAFANISRALRPGARFAQLVRRSPADNPWFREVTGALAAGPLPALSPDAPSPFALSDPDRVRLLLTGAGFRDVELEARDEPMWFGADVEHAYAFFVGLLSWMLDGLDPAARARALDQVRAVLSAHLGPGGVQLASGTWLITATRSQAEP